MIDYCMDKKDEIDSRQIGGYMSFEYGDFLLKHLEDKLLNVSEDGSMKNKLRKEQIREIKYAKLVFQLDFFVGCRMFSNGIAGARFQHLPSFAGFSAKYGLQQQISFRCLKKVF